MAAFTHPGAIGALVDGNVIHLPAREPPIHKRLWLTPDGYQIEILYVMRNGVSERIGSIARKVVE